MKYSSKQIAEGLNLMKPGQKIRVYSSQIIAWKNNLGLCGEDLKISKNQRTYQIDFQKGTIHTTGDWKEYNQNTFGIELSCKKPGKPVRKNLILFLQSPIIDFPRPIKDYFSQQNILNFNQQNL